MLSAAWRQRLLTVPGLSQDWTSLPPKSLVVDGKVRRFARDVDPNTAELMASRGLPVYIISFDGCGRLPKQHLTHFFSVHRTAFQDEGEHNAEVMSRVYGKRQGGKDERVIAVVFVA